MPRFLIDANLPYYFASWHGDDYLHVYDLNDQWTDNQIWDYARERDMVIVSKDADFSNRIMLSTPPPRIVHVRLGNMKMKDFHTILSRDWPWVRENVSKFRLIRIYADRIEGVADGE
jgi:predicted nuclease of predicted toxin-antitoxin system